jgi:archaellum component FlaG (FlaF/FlaG flagellin family)
VASELSNEFNLVENPNETAIFVVNATDSNDFSVWYYKNNGDPDVTAAELQLIGVFTSNGDVTADSFALI